VNLAEVGQVECVGAAREALRHSVVAGEQPNAPLRPALATGVVDVLGHEQR
jgi:hypothetical protein